MRQGPLEGGRRLTLRRAAGKRAVVNDTAQNLVFRPRPRGADDGGVINRVTADEAGWSLLNAEIRHLREGQRWSHESGDHELLIVLFGGRCAIRSSKGEWPEVGGRTNVFDGMPWALYLPRRTSVSIEALTPSVEWAWCWVPTDEDHPARLITPDDARVEIRGGNNATRQINSILPPGSDCHRIVAVEVYTPGGNWSSYPPHKHDAHRPGPDGALLEADLEELYLYKQRRPDGWALQRIYTDDGRIDATVTARDNDIVLVPEGYHPVSAAYGYDCYYLNFLAGSAQSLACVDDPAHAWVKSTWDAKDPRVPLVGAPTLSRTLRSEAK